ncbi:MAG: arylsulfatase [Tepidisphaeraceae bacterium]
MRRTFTNFVSAGLLLLAGGSAMAAKPNVVLIVTDDQGYGELGVTGNPVVRTPNIDRLAKSSVSLTQFYVMPVCSPTRAGLLTGRNHYRTGVTDTWMGRSLMDAKETTLAEMFASAGYHTGIFGKWHLGDNYPRRAMDQGFQESLVLNGGGLGQPSDLPETRDARGAYFDPTLLHNGKPVKTTGYVADVITDAADAFIVDHAAEPFFVYLAFNTPHTPLQVPEAYRAHYPPAAFDRSRFPSAGNPMPDKHDPIALSRVYGMIENIDDNVGKVLATLDELKLADNTIVVVLSDNGCEQHDGFNAGLRDWKGSPYEGGIRQFCFIRWPVGLPTPQQVDRLTSHMDITPTLLDLCSVAPRASVKFDGQSLASLLKGEPVDWPDRTIVFQWHRGDAPQRYRSMAVRSERWKLVQPKGRGERWDGSTSFELYDIRRDPYEQHDVSIDHPVEVRTLRAAYDTWFDELVASRDFTTPTRIAVGTPHENPVLLTRQDWRGPQANWSATGRGYWDVSIEPGGTYDITLRFDAPATDARLNLKCADVRLERTTPQGETSFTFTNVRLPEGPARLEATISTAPAPVGVRYVEVLRKEEK